MAIDAILQTALEPDGPGAAVGVLHGDEVIYGGGHGYANLEWQAPVTTKTVFRLASITKPITALAVMLLVERGELDLHAPITQYLPDYPTGGHHLTTYHLLTHTGGISNDRAAKSIFERYDLNPQALLAYFSQKPFAFKPGTAYRYSNTGYVLLGLLIEAVTGMDYADFVQTQVFAPLGMSDSYFFHHRPVIPRRASGYVWRGEAYHHAKFFSADISYAGGGLGSTIDDMLCLLQALRGNTLISAESWVQMTQPATLDDGTELHYGYGIAVKSYRGHRMLCHSGTTPGFNNQLSIFPDDDLSVLVLSNLGGFESERVTAAVARELLGLPVEKRRPFVVAGDALRQSMGRYVVDGYPVRFVREGNQLLLRTNKDRRVIAANRRTFFSPDDPDVLVTFDDEGADGLYQQMTIQTAFNTYIAHREDRV
jgi:CubicO group peptidase (beta-lactamase class C family)